MVTGSSELVMCEDKGLWIEGEVKGRRKFSGREKQHNFRAAEQRVRMDALCSKKFKFKSPFYLFLVG